MTNRANKVPDGGHVVTAEARAPESVKEPGPGSDKGPGPRIGQMVTRAEGAGL
jgi:hypothetical protein